MLVRDVFGISHLRLLQWVLTSGLPAVDAVVAAAAVVSAADAMVLFWFGLFGNCCSVGLVVE